MFKGKAELVDPEKNTPVATFTETCQSDGTAKMKVVLKAPMTISGLERLAIFSTVKDQEVIAVTANGGASTAIHEFEGTSSLGILFLFALHGWCPATPLSGMRSLTVGCCRPAAYSDPAKHRDRNFTLTM